MINEKLDLNHHIYDEKAIEIVEQLDYDFLNADKDKAMSYGVVSRTIVLDKMVGEFPDKNTETIDIRKRFLEEKGPIYQIEKSAMEESYTDEIEYNGEPVLVIIEGLTMYLSEREVWQNSHGE